MIDKEFARQQLPEETVSLFDDIVLSRVLGASKQTNLICRMLSSIMDLNIEFTEKLNRIEIITEYFKATRGQNSRAIYNSISGLMVEIKTLFSDEKNREKIKFTIDNYQKQLKDNVDKSANYAATLCSQFDTIMIFDYSSTVESFVGQLKEKKVIYIPESRALDGGRPFLKTAVSKGHEVHFIPDTTMLVELKKCQAAFIGAETIYPDGSVFNTVGADILAVICKEYNIPLYAISPMVKLDIRNKYGYTKLAPMPFDYSIRLAKGWSEKDKENIDFRSIKLVKIDAKYITGIITEFGIIPSYGMYTEALNYNIQIGE